MPAEICIEVESTQIEQRNKKGGGVYEVQHAYFQEFNRDGSPKRYPREIVVFPKKDSQGKSIPYQKGSYTLAPHSLLVSGNGFLELGFVELIPVK